MSSDLPEDWCWKTLRELRWPVRVLCPWCGSRAGRHRCRGHTRAYRCRGCRRIFSDITGTPFEGSCLPLEAMFQAIDHLRSHDRLTVSGLARSIGVDRKTARRMKRRLWPLREDPFIRSIALSILCWRI